MQITVWRNKWAGLARLRGGLGVDFRGHAGECDTDEIVINIHAREKTLGKMSKGIIAASELEGRSALDSTFYILSIAVPTLPVN